MKILGIFCNTCFCVELKNEENNRWVFADNKRPVVITNSLCGVELNSEKSNYHMISLLLNRAVAKLYPDCTDSIRVTLTVD